MGCLGVHFAIEPVVMERLLAASDDEERMAVVREIEEGGEYDEWLHDSDKSWDALHRCLTDGSLRWGSGSQPLSQAVLAGPSLHQGDGYIICLVRPEQTGPVADALADITEKDLRNRYERIPVADYGLELSEDDFLYTWENVSALQQLFAKASDAGRAIIFTADQ